MPKCLDVVAWRIANRDELVAFTEGLGKLPIARGRKRKLKEEGSRHLIVRRRLKQADLYAYLRARFGVPNGFQNFLRSDSSDNLIHWDFVIKAGDKDVYIQGVMRDIHFLLSESLTDDEWKVLILAIKSDFARIRREKSAMMKSFEKYLVFQNKFAVLANLCADLHASITDAPPQLAAPPRVTRRGGMKQYKAALDAVSKRAIDLYGDCLKLKLLMPIMAEAFINMLILVFCKDDIRKDQARYEHLEFINKPTKVVADYEAIHIFILELTQMLSARHQEFFEQVIEDTYPGFEAHKRRVTKILPGHNAAFIFGHEKYDDDLDVEW